MRTAGSNYTVDSSVTVFYHPFAENSTETSCQADSAVTRILMCSSSLFFLCKIKLFFINKSFYSYFVGCWNLNGFNQHKLLMSFFSNIHEVIYR